MLLPPPLILVFTIAFCGLVDAFLPELIYEKLLDYSAAANLQDQSQYTVKVRCFFNANKEEWTCPDPLATPLLPTTVGDGNENAEIKEFNVQDDFLLDLRNWDGFLCPIDLAERLRDRWVSDYLCTPVANTGRETANTNSNALAASFCNPSSQSKLHVFLMLGIGWNSQQDCETWQDISFPKIFDSPQACAHLVYNPSWKKAVFDTVLQKCHIPTGIGGRKFIRHAREEIITLLNAGHKVLVMSDSYGGLGASRLAEQFSGDRRVRSKVSDISLLDNLRFMTFASLSIPPADRVRNTRILHFMNLNDCARRVSHIKRPRQMHDRRVMFDRKRSIIWARMDGQELIRASHIFVDSREWGEHFDYTNLMRRMLRLAMHLSIGKPLVDSPEDSRELRRMFQIAMHLSTGEPFVDSPENSPANDPTNPTSPTFDNDDRDSS